MNPTKPPTSLVAVAGGTSPTLGKSIVEAILATGKHQVIILSRAPPNSTPSSNTNTNETKYGAPIHHVDYDSLSSLTTSLRNVTTLISVLKLPAPGAMESIHSTLLAACRATSVSRFIMSDWSQSTLSHTRVDALAHKATLLSMCAAENARADSHTSCCTVQIGMFMNYFAQGGGREWDGGLVDDFMREYVDVQGGVVVVPVTAEGRPIKTSMTHLLDVGALVAASLELPPHKMQGSVGLVSQDEDWECVSTVLEQRCGLTVPRRTITREQCEVRVAEYGRKAREAVDRGEFDMAAFMGHMVAQMMAVVAGGEDGGSLVPATLNQMLREAGLEVRTRRVEDMLVGAWGK